MNQIKIKNKINMNKIKIKMWIKQTNIKKKHKQMIDVHGMNNGTAPYCDVLSWWTFTDIFEEVFFWEKKNMNE